MINLKLLEKRGCSPESLREIFTRPETRVPTFDPNLESADAGTKPAEAEPKKKKPKKKPETDLEKQNERVNALRNRIRLRIQNGWDWNLSTWRPFHAINRAMDVPLEKAVTPTMLGTLVNRPWKNTDELCESLRAWGYNLDDVVCEVPDPKVDGKSQLKVHVPSFFQIVPPLVLAYKTIRQAKIMNDLNQTPYFEYHPAFESAKSRLQCDVITNRVEVMSEQYGYYNVDDQAVSNMLTYGRAFKFPKEEWHSEEQEVEDAEDAAVTFEQEEPATPPEPPEVQSPVEPPLPDASTNEGKPLKNKAGQYYRVVKEGIRYDVPPPERVYWDQAHPPHTLNTDTGCEWAGYWSVKRYRDLLDDPGYFNKDRISIGNYAWSGGWETFFSTIYPCQMRWPTLQPMGNDRETKLMDQIYSTDMGDKAVAVTNHFEKLIPNDWGLGTYRYPVWFRFVVASDDTIIYAAPLPYAPTVAYLYDHDQNKANTPSLALEVLPWQDHFGMLLSQTILSIKRNLDNVTFVDKTMVKKDTLDKLRNLGEAKFRSRNFVTTDGKANFAAQNNLANAFFSPQFPMLDTNGTMQAMRLLLDVLERVLQMSAQELGQAASHEQSAKETGIIAQQTSTRLAYTTTPVVQAREATKKQLYYGLMAYGEESFWAQIPNDRQITPELLAELDFIYNEKEHPAHAHSKHMTVRVKKSSLMLERFSQIRTNETDRQHDIESGQAMLNMIGQIMKGPMGPGIGIEQAIELTNRAVRMIGFPRDFRLKNMSPQLSPEQQAEQVKQQLAGFIKEIHDSIIGEVKQAMTPMLQTEDMLKKKTAMLEQAVEHIAEINESHPHLQTPVPVPSNGTPMSPYRF